jgi:radical SAM superfamily enzyme YgiQ (UPF0313 family)
LARKLREAYDIPILLGGPHATSFPERTLKENPFIDIIVVGEGEDTIVDLLEYFDGRRKALDEIPGIGYRKGHNICLTPPRLPRKNLDEIPMVDRKLFHRGKYVPLPNQYKRIPAATLVTSRGCPYKCTFCFEAGRFGLKYRQQSVERVVDEIEYLINEHGVREIGFWDDIFTLNRKWIHGFCDRLEEKGLDITWQCEARVDNVTRDMLMRMAEVGCHSIFYGLESGVQALLDNIKKETTVEQNRQATKWANEAGIDVRGSFMLAIPGETPELARQTIDFILSLDLYSLQISYTTPFPGTELYDSCLESGRFMDGFGENYADFSSFNVVYLPDGYESPEQVVALQKEAYRRFYFRPSYIWKNLKRLRSLDDLFRLASGLKFVLGITL